MVAAEMSKLFGGSAASASTGSASAGRGAGGRVSPDAMLAMIGVSL